MPKDMPSVLWCSALASSGTLPASRLAPLLPVAQQVDPCASRLAATRAPGSKWLRRGLLLCALAFVTESPADAQVGQERSSYKRLQDGEEHEIPLRELIERGRAAFTAQWTPVEGVGRPFSTGTGASLAHPGSPLVFPRNFNRVSAQDANSCAGCHNAPFGMVGGGGDFVTGVFVAAQRFDFASFDHAEFTPGQGAIDETGAFATLQSIGNYRATLGMFGSGFIEMLARQMTRDLQNVRDALHPGGTAELTAKGVSFGILARSSDGRWDVSGVEGLPPQSLASASPADPPTLIIHPFHQSGTVVSLRQFTNNAFNHHHGMQSVERFGAGTDPDGDGVTDELTRADITAAVIFQAALPVPSQVMPRDPEVRQAVRNGERLFDEIGCSNCHVPALPLSDGGWVFSEPNPYNPAGNLQPGETRPLTVDLTDARLGGKRPRVRNGIVTVRAYTDLKLHDITSGPSDPNGEAIDINRAAGSTEFFSGNREFLTKKLWGAANEPPYFHHGLFTTLRQATLAHDGEARTSRLAFEALTAAERNQVIEFLKSLRMPEPVPGNFPHQSIKENGI